jgi:hypothetical protein
MKRRQFLQAAGLGLSATAVTKPAIAQSMPELGWRRCQTVITPRYGRRRIVAFARYPAHPAADNVVCCNSFVR